MKKLDLPPFWLLGSLIATALLWFVFPGLAFHFDGHRLVSYLMLAAGLGLGLLAVREMKRADTAIHPRTRPRALVTSGVFAWSRNPIYLGVLVVLGSGIMFWGSYPALALLVLLFLVLQNRFIKDEEAALRADFAVAFNDWSQKTRRWI